jgi:hypothetical protein
MICKRRSASSTIGSKRSASTFNPAEIDGSATDGFREATRESTSKGRCQSVFHPATFNSDARTLRHQRSTTKRVKAVMQELVQPLAIVLIGVGSQDPP